MSGQHLQTIIIALESLLCFGLLIIIIFIALLLIIIALDVHLPLATLVGQQLVQASTAIAPSSAPSGLAIPPSDTGVPPEPPKEAPRVSQIMR